MNFVRRRIVLAGIAAALLAFHPRAEAAAGGPLRVVATIPDLADVVQRIGGERVAVQTLTRGRENLHHVVARPSHLVALSRADVLVQVGLSLEVGFLPGLLENAGNDRIRPGKPGFVSVSAGYTPIDVPTVVTRKDGDVHPDGNPHINLDPAAGTHVAERILAGLVACDPDGRAEYEARATAYRQELAAAQTRWSAAAKEWSGRRVVVYHREFDYLVARYGLDVIGSIESKPGIPPTPGHVAQLVRAMQAKSPVVILTAPWSNGGDVEEIAKATGAKVVELPNQAGGTPGAETWIGLMDLVHARLGEAFGTTAPKR